MQPLRFLRALFCVDSSYRQLRGNAAAVRGCPTGPAGSRRFRSANPALFRATGWVHHPYHLQAAPNVPSSRTEADWVTLAELPKLERALDRIQLLYGSHQRFALYLTEYGYETNPPASFNVSPSLQGAYLNQAEYMAWRDPRVQTLSQYLLVDAPPRGGSSISSFASGLIFVNGTEKASYAAYRLPIWMPVTRLRAGNTLQVWGSLRAAKAFPGSTMGPVAIQLDGRTVRQIPVTNPKGYFDVRVIFPHGGSVRLTWTYPGGPTIYSRRVTVSNPPRRLDLMLPILLLSGAVMFGVPALIQRHGLPKVPGRDVLAH